MLGHVSYIKYATNIVMCIVCKSSVTVLKYDLATHFGNNNFIIYIVDAVYMSLL